jgi:hypothetical protein
MSPQFGNSIPPHPRRLRLQIAATPNSRKPEATSTLDKIIKNPIAQSTSSFGPWAHNAIHFTRLPVTCQPDPPRTGGGASPRGPPAGLNRYTIFNG